MRILVVQTSFLGDTILSTPLIGALKQLYPGCEIWTLTTKQGEELLRRDPLITGRLIYDKRGQDAGLSAGLELGRRLREKAFDRAYILQRSLRTALLMALSGIRQRTAFREAALSCLHQRRVRRPRAQHEVMRNLSILSAETDINGLDGELRLFAPEWEELALERRRKLDVLRGCVVLVPGSVWRTKMWHWQGYRRVAEHLSGRGFSVAVVGSAAEKEVCARVAQDLAAIDLSGDTSISEALLVIKHARLVVCNDSMALHAASAFKTPALAIFCATSPAFGFGPWRNRALVVEKEGLGCKPCSRHGTRRCPLGTESCMRELEPRRIIEGAELLLRGESTVRAGLEPPLANRAGGGCHG